MHTHYQIWGEEFIDAAALEQMQNASDLPISIQGALMPDAHVGYGLPIGGVLATEASKIIPYAVGVDIACRVKLSVFPISAHELEKHKKHFIKLLENNTHFGIGGKSREKIDSSLFNRKIWSEIPILKKMQSRAMDQLGTSGSGNHFVEFGIVKFKESLHEDIDINKNYLGLLSHSGSRGLGANIANHYSKIAMQESNLPKNLRHLAWLDINTEIGQEYWLAMNLAGDYASENHREIHDKMIRDINSNPILQVENHHNFAWKEELEDGEKVMVHRKGATPAGKGVLGFIPGTMSDPGYLVRGLGNKASINSAAHGAGRVLSRRKAKSSLDKKDWYKRLKDEGVHLLSAGLDEAPMAYKNIDKVMNAQKDLVEIVARFDPKIVKMADGNERPED
ncbi:MAG TPA: RtcB family protein [Chitinophagaceae bacterium]|nr:RtcB family protein [Chitinophagaceae bacterium]